MPGKRMSALCLALIAGLSISLTGCKTDEADVRASESPQAEHPQGEHAQAEHPQGEHPSNEHPSSEHPSRN